MSFLRPVTLLVCLTIGLGFGLALAQPASANGNCTTYFVGQGTGTPSDPYQVDSALDLEEISYCLSASFVQTGNIDLASAPWTPLGPTNGSPFTGSYDGGGYTIAGLNVSATIAFQYAAAGLFGYADHATLTGIRLSSGNITGDMNVGALVGWAQDSAISRSSAALDVTGWSNVGGLIGYATVTTGQPTQALTEVFTAGTVTGTTNRDPDEPVAADNVGGLVGGADNLDVTKSYSSATVTSNGTKTGGLFGALAVATVTDSFSSGMVTGDWQVGGLIGNRYRTSITNSYAVGTVTAGGPDRTRGGLVGQGTETTWSAATWNTLTTGQTAAEGSGDPHPPGTTASTTTQMQSIETFIGLGWNISSSWTPTTTWVICSTFNGGYPHLAAFYDEFTAPCFTAPATPAAVTAVAGDAQAVVTVHPQVGGPAASWLITSTPGSLACSITGASGSCAITGLVNGTSYTFTSTATNRIGTSAASPASAAVTPQSPGGGSTPTPTSTPTLPAAQVSSPPWHPSWAR